MSGPLEVGLSVLAYYAACRSEEMSVTAEASYAAVGLFKLLNEAVLSSERATSQRGERLILSALDQVGSILTCASPLPKGCSLTGVTHSMLCINGLTDAELEDATVQLGILLEVSAIQIEHSRGHSRYNALFVFEAIRRAC